MGDVQLKEGLIHNLPFGEYLKLPCLNAGKLKEAAKGPKHYIAKLTQPDEDKVHLRLGRAGHTGILEPDQFLLDYTVYKDRRAGKKWDAFQEANADKTILTVKEYEQTLAIRDAGRAHPLIRKYLDEPGEAELTMVWQHKPTGQWCKGRIDWLCSVLLDLKTSRVVEPHAFSTAAERLGYAIQFAFYADGLAQITGDALPFKVAAIQSAPPYEAAVYDVSNNMLAAGTDRYEQAMEVIAECNESGLWPGRFDKEELTLDLPAWATTGIDDEPLTFGGEVLAAI